jgi:hypothetical protein
VSVVERFFSAYANADPVAMSACLHPQISYSDPLFPDLRGVRVGLRWHWQLRHATEFKLQKQIMFMDERKAQLKLDVAYLWHGRAVHHEVLSTLTIWDDLIVRQIDEYPYWPYAKQAYGVAGHLLGGLGWAQSVVQRRAAAAVEELATSAGTILGESTVTR